jgi:archaellum biogenesis protein FlaJ (TadC family)
MPDLTDFFSENQAVLLTIGGVSLVLFLGTLVAVPFMVLRIPPDYFAHQHRPASRFAKRGPAVRAAMLTVRTILGVVFVLAGLAMLMLPGQGLLTLLAGFLLLPLPGKYRVEQWIIARRWVIGPINALRRRRQRPALVRPPHRQAAAADRVRH